MKHKKTIEQNVFRFIENNNLLAGAKKILIALSGGADSVFALYFFCKFKIKFNVAINAVHINHNLRGSESKRDEKFCKDICKKLKVDFYSVNVDVKSLALNKKLSTEEAARILRYKEIEKIAKKIEADRIITAHNLEDNTETVLLNLINGTGLNGLAGIPLKRDKVIRPFLCLSKNEILQYLRDIDIEYVSDSSNINLEFRRNYLRHQIIPKLKNNINPAIDKNILASSKVIRNQLQLLNFFSEDTFYKIIKVQGGGYNLSITELNKYPQDLWGEIFKLLFSKHLKIDYSFNQYEKLRKLIFSQVGTKTELGKKVIAHRERAKIFIEKSISEKFKETRIAINQTKKVFESYLSIEQIDKIPENFVRNSHIEYISGDSIKDELSIRTWEIGDIIQLLGMKGTKKISDVLTNLKIPSHKRKNQLVLVNKNDVVWIVGKRISEKYKITNDTKIKLKLCLK